MIKIKRNREEGVKKLVEGIKGKMSYILKYWRYLNEMEKGHKSCRDDLKKSMIRLLN